MLLRHTVFECYPICLSTLFWGHPVLYLQYNCVIKIDVCFRSVDVRDELRVKDFVPYPDQAEHCVPVMICERKPGERRKMKNDQL